VHDSDRRPGWRGWAGKAALAVGGLLVGGVLVGTLTANAATSSTQSAAAAGSASTQESRATFPAHGTPAHENLEKPVTGAAADKARAAAVKAVGGGTAGAVTTDVSGNGYEVTVTKSDGSKVEVHLDQSFNLDDHGRLGG
jgi:hypothetical protein